MSPSSVPFPSSTSTSTSTSSSGSSRTSLLAKWNRDARLSISNKSVASTIVISAPLPLGSAVRRDSLIPRPSSSSRKRSHKEIVTNENLDIEEERARVRQRTVKPASASPIISKLHSKVEEGEPTRAVTRDGAIVTVHVQARPGQAKKTLKALRDRLRIQSTRGRGRTEDAVVLNCNEALPTNVTGSRIICPPPRHPRQDIAISSDSSHEEPDRVVPRPDVQRKDDKCNENENENDLDPRPSKPQRGRKTVHFLLTPTQPGDKEMARRPVDLSKAKSPLQQRNANLSHISSTSPRAAPAKALLTTAVEPLANLKAESESSVTNALRREAIFKPPVSLTADQLKLSIAFYNSPHFEIWDMEDNIFVAWPAELRLEALDSDRWEFTSLIQPEILQVDLQCHSKYYCKDGDHTKYPYAICDSDSWYSVNYGGAVCRDGMRSTVVPAAGIHVASQWERTYKRRVEPTESTVTKGDGGGGSSARRSKSLELPAERGWVLKFWIPIPTYLFVKRETRSFIIESNVWLVDDKDKVLNTTAEMTISHLRREREMV